MAQLLTLGAASRQSGVSTKALSKAIRDGRLQATRVDDWMFQIDQAELDRFLLIRDTAPAADAVTAPAAPAAAASERIAAATVPPAGGSSLHRVEPGRSQPGLLPFLRRLLQGKAASAA